MSPRSLRAELHMSVLRGVANLVRHERRYLEHQLEKQLTEIEGLAPEVERECIAIRQRWDQEEEELRWAQAHSPKGRAQFTRFGSDIRTERKRKWKQRRRFEECAHSAC